MALHRLPAASRHPGNATTLRDTPSTGAILTAGQQLQIRDSTRRDAVREIAADEHVSSHTRRGARCITFIIDLTPIRDGTGPFRLLDMVPGRSKKMFKAWPDGRTNQLRNGIEVVAMDEFFDDRTATAKALPEATAVKGPFHVVALFGEKDDECRQRIQQATQSGIRSDLEIRSAGLVACGTPARNCSPTSSSSA